MPHFHFCDFCDIPWSCEATACDLSTEAPCVTCLITHPPDPVIIAQNKLLLAARKAPNEVVQALYNDCLQRHNDHVLSGNAAVENRSIMHIAWSVMVERGLIESRIEWIQNYGDRRYTTGEKPKSKREALRRKAKYKPLEGETEQALSLFKRIEDKAG